MSGGGGHSRREEARAPRRTRGARQPRGMGDPLRRHVDPAHGALPRAVRPRPDRQGEGRDRRAVLREGGQRREHLRLRHRQRQRRRWRHRRLRPARERRDRRARRRRPQAGRDRGEQRRRPHRQRGRAPTGDRGDQPRWHGDRDPGRHGPAGRRGRPHLHRPAHLRRGHGPRAGRGLRDDRQDRLPARTARAWWSRSSPTRCCSPRARPTSSRVASRSSTWWPTRSLSCRTT